MKRIFDKALLGAIILIFSIGAPLRSSHAQVEQTGRAARVKTKDPRAEIMRLVRELDLDEKDPQAALRALREYPRDKIARVVREALASGGRDGSACLRAAEILELQELIPDLRARLKGTPDWRIPLTLATLSKSETEKAKTVELFIESLDTSDSAAVKVALIDGLGELNAKIPISIYKKLVTTDNADVQFAAVHHLLALRKRYSTVEQTERFKLALEVKSVNGRYDAYRGLASLDEADRKSLGVSILTSKTCAIEKDEKLQKACQEAAAASGGVR